MRFQEDVHQCIRESELVRAGERVLLAVSGGADSVALLRVLHALSGRLGISLVAAHLDHGLRGDEGAADAEFVRAAARRLGLDAVVERRVVETRRGESIEAAARRVRYAFLGDAARASGSAAIATGHTANDQAETVLLRMLRGAGPRGLAAIPIARALVEGEPTRVVRPLLGRTRAEVMRYLAEIGAEYRTDATNRSRQHLRNRVRHDILPRLESEIDPAAVRTLARLAARAREIDGYLREEAARWLQSHVVESREGRIALDAAAFASAPAALAPDILRLALRHALPTGPGAPDGAGGPGGGSPRDAAALQQSHIAACLALARGRPGRRLAPLPAGLAARRVGDRLEILARAATADLATRPDAAPCSPSPLAVPGAVELAADAGPIRIRAERTERTGAAERHRGSENGSPAPFSAPGDSPAAPARTVCGRGGRIAVEFDWEGISAPLEVRSRRRGDRIAPRGMSGSKSLQDLFVDRKVPWTERERVPVVADRSRILWVVGHAVSREAPITSATRHKLVLACESFSYAEGVPMKLGRDQ